MMLTKKSLYREPISAGERPSDTLRFLLLVTLNMLLTWQEMSCDKIQGF